MSEHRSGIGTPYWYEWEIGLLRCLEMMTNMSINSVTLQSLDFKSLDDVVINYTDGSSSNIQVKHTDVDSNFTYSTLISDNPSMLISWAKDWKENKDCYQITEIHIITNKKWGPNERDGRCSFSHFVESVFPVWKLDYSFSGKNLKEQNAISWFKEQICFLSEDAPAFVRLLIFEQEGNLAEVEKNIELKIAQILGTDDANAISQAKKSLLAELSIWATSRRDKQEISREDVYKVLCCDSKQLPKYDLYPEKPIFPSRVRFAEEFSTLIRTTDKKIVFLEGMPGAGKTNFISYLAQLKDSPVDFRFYTYLPVSKNYPSYSDDEGYYSGDFLWRSILFQLKKAFEEMGKLSELDFPLIYSYLSISEMRETVLKYLPIYAGLVGHPCYFFIDGLDHAARSKSSRESFLFQLPRPDEIADSVKFILVSQPLNENFPKWLSNNSQIEYSTLPVLEQDDVIMLLETESGLQGVDINSLAQSVIELVGNNALNVLFAIQEVKTSGSSPFEDIIEQLKQKKLNGQISGYYDWIVSSLPNDTLLQTIEFAFAFLSQKVKLEQIALLCGKRTDEVAFSLAKLFPLIVENNGYYFVFHNDVRLFFRQSIVAARYFSSLAVAVKDRIEAEETIGQLKYDVVFESFLEIDDIDSLLSIVTPEYIIKSVRYNISLNKLLSQFESTLRIVESKNAIESLHKLSLVATTIQQFLSCVSYYAKEAEYFENPTVAGKTRSEKYILDTNTDLATIVHDTYLLLRNGEFSRAKSVFDEYLCSCILSQFLSIPIEDYEHGEMGIHEQCGFICRHFNQTILSQSDPDEEAYLRFVKGWLNASVVFPDPQEVETTFSFRTYLEPSLFEYISDVCKQEIMTKESFSTLNSLLCGHHVHIAILIELCVNEILSDEISEELIQEIQHRYSEIVSDETDGIFHYTYTKILCFFKLLFCVYPRLKDANVMTEYYELILHQSRVYEGRRGYLPAMRQLECAYNAFSAFYGEKCDNDAIIEAIYSMEYIGDKYGSGSCHDCEAYSVRRFVIKIIRKAYERKKDQTKTSELCKELMYLFTGEHARYDTELASLFVVANEKEKVLNIALRWAGPDGLMWKKEYDDLEHCYNSISRILKHFDLHELNNEIELRKAYRIISYSGHKDYSLNDLLGWYRAFPLCQEKLLRWGVQLLSISDSAYEIGDNRMANPIDNEIFQTAVELGPQFVDGLFELKNTPEDFHYWRECLLNAYWEKLHQLKLNDSELLSLYQIVNAWINVKIEERKQNGYNKIKYLQHYNSVILEAICDQAIKEQIKAGGYCNYEEEWVEPVKQTEPFEWILKSIEKEGYSKKVQEQIRSSLKCGTAGKVNFLLSVGGVVAKESIEGFVHDCVIEYILSESKYSMQENGFDQLFEKYSLYFSDSDWEHLFAYVLSKSTSNSDMFYCVSHDLEILDLYFSTNRKKDQIESLYSDKMNLHWSMITACGLISRESYSVSLDPQVNSLQEFAKKHLGL